MAGVVDPRRGAAGAAGVLACRRTWPSTCCSGSSHRSCSRRARPSGSRSPPRRAGGGCARLHAVPLRPAVGWAAFTAVMLGTHLTGWYELALPEPVRPRARAPRVPARGPGLLDPARRRRSAPARARPGRAAGLAAGGDATDGPRRRAPADAEASRTPPIRTWPTSVRRRGLMWGAGSLLMSAALVAIVFRRPAARGAPQRRREAAAHERAGRAARGALLRPQRPQRSGPRRPATAHRTRPRAVRLARARPATEPTLAASPARAPRWSGAGAAAADFYL